MTNRVPRRTIPRKRRRNPRSLRSFYRISLLAIILLAVIGGGVFGYYYFSSRVFHDTIAAMASRADTPDKAFPGKSEINLLIMGRDEDRDRHGRVLHHTKGRTDAIMVAHIDFHNRTANILSIPRDTLVRIPGCRGRRRINSANAIGGPDLAQRTIADFLGVCPDYYVLMNFGGFEKAIDAMGGVRVSVDKQLDYDDSWGNLHIHLTPGQQVLNGNQAMGFVRYRHANGGGGDSDLVRIGRQQELIGAMKSRLANPSVLLKVPGILDDLRTDMDANMSTAQMICVARFLRSLPRGSAIKMATIPTAEGSRIYVRADQDATRELVDRMFKATQQ